MEKCFITFLTNHLQLDQIVFFLLILLLYGAALFRTLIQAPYCHKSREPNNCTKTEFNYDTDYGGTSLGMWVGRVGNATVYPANKEVLHYNFKYNIHTSDVCGEYLLYHKASPESLMYLHNKQNPKRVSATSGKLFFPSKIRSFNTTQLNSILRSKVVNPKIEKWCETVAVVTTIFELTDAVSNILKVTFYWTRIVQELILSLGGQRAVVSRSRCRSQKYQKRRLRHCR